MNLPSASCFNRFITLVFCLILITYSSCKKDSPEPEPPVPTAAELTTALLKGPTWVMLAVTVDGVVLDLYKNLGISFTEDGKYTSVNGGAIWPATGTWKFKDDQAKVMVRDDGLEIGIDALAEKSMTISFTREGPPVFADPTGGRTSAVGGKHVLTLGR